MRRRNVGGLAGLAAVVTLAVAVALAPGTSGAAGDAAGGPPVAATWSAVLAGARGQTVRWWMYGGDQRINDYVDSRVAPAAARLGVRLVRVAITDTAAAVQRVIAQRQAGRTSGGAVDLIWINGENFAAGKQAGLWLKQWSTTLPNARYVDWGSAAIARDLQVPVVGQESPWSSAAFVFAYDSARVARPPRTLAALLAWAKAHPGRFTYPAPPDFTGSAFVRQVVQRLASRARAIAFLKALRPYQYDGGRSFPQSQAELDRLFGDGQVGFAMSYDPSFVSAGVRKGAFPHTARPFLIGGGALVNTSYVTIPADAAHRDGALVVANLLLDPRLQAIKADPAVLGVPTVLDLSRLDQAQRRLFDRSSGSPYLLPDFGAPLSELSAFEVGPIEQQWLREVLR